MKLEVEKLSGKYYRTSTTFIFDDGREVWAEFYSSDSEPSKRQIKDWGYIQKDWDNNIEVEDGWGGKVRIRESDYRCDGHYERKATEDLLKIILTIIKQKEVLISNNK